MGVSNSAAALEEYEAPSHIRPRAVFTGVRPAEPKNNER